MKIFPLQPSKDLFTFLITQNLELTKKVAEIKIQMNNQQHLQLVEHRLNNWSELFVIQVNLFINKIFSFFQKLITFEIFLSQNILYFASVLNKEVIFICITRILFKTKYFLNSFLLKDKIS